MNPKIHLLSYQTFRDGWFRNLAVIAKRCPLDKKYMKEVTPLLMFDEKTEESIGFYISLFEDTKIIDITR